MARRRAGALFGHALCRLGQLGARRRAARHARLVEQRIEQHLQAHGATSADLHALLAETTGGDARADRFLAIVLGLEDYGQFCGLMQAHAASLAVAAEMESVALS